MKFLIKTMAGLEQVLADELRALGAEQIEPLTRAVACVGDRRLLYRANLELRSALRVLIPLRSFSIRSEDDLYQQLDRIDWSEYLSVEDTLAVDAVANSDRFRHSKFLALKTKDAIADQFRRRMGRRPSVDVERPTLRVNLHVYQTEVTVSLDSSGDSLHRRGYRTESVEAPINEVLAAGMVLLSGWQRDCAFVDPMCGSGTILIEAAMLARNMAPQLQRRDPFGFQRWPDFDRALWESIRQEAQARIRPFEHGLYGYDRDFRALRSCHHNILAARLEGHIQVDRQRFETLAPPADRGLLIMNPPYDERLPIAQTTEFYQMIGNSLKQRFKGYEAWIISSNKDALKFVGLRPSRKITVFNGALECKYQKYELFEGSRKGEGGNGKSEVGNRKSEGKPGIPEKED